MKTGTTRAAIPLRRRPLDPCSPSPRMFWEFCAIRQEEWRRRQIGGPPPFTHDPVLQVREIPNVYRELDGPNIFLNNHIKGRSVEDCMFGAVAFRLTNRLPPHESFGGVPRAQQWEAWLAHVNREFEQGTRLFTRIFHTPSLTQYGDALTILAKHSRELADEVREAKGLPQVFHAFSKIPRVRNFFAWQCTADTLEAGGVNFDEDTWVYLGPGPLRALHMMYGQRFGQREAVLIARRLWEVQDKALATTLTPWVPPPPSSPVRQGPRLTMKNIEHALCEYLRWVWAHWRKS